MLRPGWLPTVCCELPTVCCCSHILFPQQPSSPLCADPTPTPLSPSLSPASKLWLCSKLSCGHRPRLLGPDPSFVRKRRCPRLCMEPLAGQSWQLGKSSRKHSRPKDKAQLRTSGWSPAAWAWHLGIGANSGEAGGKASYRRKRPGLVSLVVLQP